MNSSQSPRVRAAATLGPRSRLAMEFLKSLKFGMVLDGVQSHVGDNFVPPERATLLGWRQIKGLANRCRRPVAVTFRKRGTVRCCISGSGSGQSEDAGDIVHHFRSRGIAAERCFR